MTPLQRARRRRLRKRRLAIVRRARQESLAGDAVWRNLCQKFVRTMCGAPGGVASARVAWQSYPPGQTREPGNRRPPMGVPVYFRLGTPYWHAAISAGAGYVWSTDIVRWGRPDKVSIDYVERRWNAEYLGWATHSNGVRVW